ncbi:hypothetical protein [Pendulispora albinea]|uniref:WD40 repeat domain-containing protein n=1 Tax=Pendulispora albinea TaxID=2741071 RepID=A0ABZ2MA30_9BACT
MYDLEAGKEIRRFAGDNDAQTPVLLPDGRHMLGADGALHLWDLDTTKKKPTPLWSVFAPPGYFMPAVHPNGQWCVLRLRDKLHIRSIADGALIREVPLSFGFDVLGMGFDAACAILPDGKRSLWVMDSQQSVVQVIDLETGERLTTLEGHRLPITALALAPNGARFATIAKDGALRVWDTASLRRSWMVTAHQGEGTGAAFLDDDTIVTTGTDGVAYVWHIDDDEQPAMDVREPSDNVIVGRATPDGRHLFALHADGFLREWTTATGTCSRRFDASTVPRDGTFRLWFPREGHYLLLTRDGAEDKLFPAIGPPIEATVFRFDRETGECHLLYRADEVPTEGIVPVDENTIYVGRERSRGVWRVALAPPGPPSKELIAQGSLPARTLVAKRWSTSLHGNHLTVFDTENPTAGAKTMAEAVKGIFSTVRAHVGPDRTWLAAASTNTQITIVQLPDGSPRGTFGGGGAPLVRPAAVAFSANGTEVYGASPEGELVEWSLESGTTRSWQLPDAPVHGLATHPSLGPRVAAQTKAAIALLDTRSGELVARMEYPSASNVDSFSPIVCEETLALQMDSRLLFLRFESSTPPA